MTYSLLTLKFVVLSVIFMQTDCLECQDGFIRHGPSCYHFSHDTETWVDAANVCSMIYGGYLAEANDPTERNFLINMSKRDNTDYWIGGNDLKVEGEWKWYNSNQPIPSDPWGKGQPSNDNGDENCLEIMVTVYNDDACHKAQRYICEISEISGEIVG